MTEQTMTQTTTTSSDERDLQEAEHIRRHHAHLVAELDGLTRAFHEADDADTDRDRAAVATFLDDSLLPHARGEEETIYRAAAGLESGAPLVDALVREHQLIQQMVSAFGSSSPADARVWGLAISETFRSHQAKEDEVVVPLLLAAPGVSLVEAHAGH